MCNANKLPLFGGVFATSSVSPYYRKHCSTYTFGGCTHREHGYAGTGPSKPHIMYFHNECPGSTGQGNASSIIFYCKTHKTHKTHSALCAKLTVHYVQNSQYIMCKTHSTLCAKLTVHYVQNSQYIMCKTHSTLCAKLTVHYVQNSQYIMCKTHSTLCVKLTVHYVQNAALHMHNV